MANLALNLGLWVRRLHIGGSPHQGRHLAPEVNDRNCPENPVNLIMPWYCIVLLLTFRLRAEPTARQAPWRFHIAPDFGPSVITFRQARPIPS